jgi:hypothetical protein
VTISLKIEKVLFSNAISFSHTVQSHGLLTVPSPEIEKTVLFLTFLNIITNKTCA